MTYQELHNMTQGHTLPQGSRNKSGEVVIISRGTDCSGRKFFAVKTYQENGWIRTNHIYEDGSTEELYTR